MLIWITSQGAKDDPNTQLLQAAAVWIASCICFCLTSKWRIIALFVACEDLQLHFHMNRKSSTHHLSFWQHDLKKSHCSSLCDVKNDWAETMLSTGKPSEPHR
jgi:hypothetical protein